MAKILLAEDEPFISKMITMRLSLRGHEIALAKNGQEAFNMASQSDYQLVLMDMHMPVMDGHEATRNLREAGYSGLIVAVTASAMSEDCQAAILSGCDGHIPKPIDEEFEQIIEDYLQRASATNG